MATNYGTIKSNGSNIKILSSEIYHTGGGKTLDSILFPVGSVYITVVNTNPSTWFGGTWSLLCPGRTLVCVDTSDSDFNTVKKTGGEKTHKLTIEEMPTHRHSLEYNEVSSIGATSYCHATGGYGKQYSDYNLGFYNIGQTGGSQAHNNLQPYMTVYIWQRTA